MIIDGHAHIYPDHAAEKVVSSFLAFHHMEPTASVGKGTADDLIAKMNAAGVEYTVLANFAPVKSIYKTNDWTLRTAENNPQFIPLVSVFPGMPLSQLTDYFRRGAKGIKMHNGIQGFDPADPDLHEIYSFCNEKRIPITYHCGETSRVHMNEYTDMDHILPVVKQYENIPFVLTHLAASDPDIVLQAAQECPNAIFDTSIALTGECCIHRIHDSFWESDQNTASLIRKIGADRFAFGSDYPFGNPASDISRFRQLDLSDEEKYKILGLNTYRLYFEDSNLKQYI